MNLMTSIRRKDAEAFIQHPDVAGLEIRLIPRDEWHAQRGTEVELMDRDWFLLDCAGPAAQVAKLRHHPELGDPAYLNLMVTIGDVEEFPSLYA